MVLLIHSKWDMLWTLLSRTSPEFWISSNWILYRSNMRLSRGATLKRFFQPGARNSWSQRAEWHSKLALFVDLTTFLSELMWMLQGHRKLISTLSDSIKTFQRKLQRLQGWLIQGNLAHFPTCKALANDHDIWQHLHSDKNDNLMEKLQEEFHLWFADFRDHKKSFSLFGDQPEFVCLLSLIREVVLIKWQNHNHCDLSLIIMAYCGTWQAHQNLNKPWNRE